jgi:hypothetical protein
MNYYESEARLLFARERAALLASEMRKAQGFAKVQRTGSARRLFAAIARKTARRGSSFAPASLP